MTLPALFIAHGSPALALEDNDYTQFLTHLGRKIKTPRAIVIFSAHWDQPVQHITDDKLHETLHDFYGFPEPLYNIEYPVRGDSEVVTQVEQLFKKSNLPYQKVQGRGLDHGAWVILRTMYPDANIPVVELSIDSRRSPKEQYDIGAMLSSLREQDVLIIGSGGLVHNLRMVRHMEGPQDFAAQFDDWIGEQLAEWNTNHLFGYEKKAPNARLAVPAYGTEHIAPFFYAMGAADNGRKAKKLFQMYQMGSISLNVWSFGNSEELIVL
ncbi:class III extradiol ring-cleavage dioxygenase [Paenibacillus sediminis]|uniref:4,5-DOPA dioxygenase extradiol n=1 Tax=Paenibacillus sediminis TaxID=664909 RepID=A0ABS4H5B5_9BACL|nr:class III extradiol ring-cleavage dioxygenase [Paenibacillus sediminis]MBP1937676.1 4,5-DOPA dioxygenase extradiol [Paenibacillus sediminis]